MGPALLIGLVIAIALAAVLFFVFFWSIVSIIVNVGLLYLVAMRLYYKFRQNDVLHYLIGIAAAALIVTLLGNFFPFWRITNIAVLGAIIAELIYWLPRMGGSKRRRRR